MRETKPTTRSIAVALLLGLAAFALILIGQTPAARADDRELLIQGICVDPYLFILFDNTGSMQRRVDNGNTATARDDDPASRAFQAKQALDAVLPTCGMSYGVERGVLRVSAAR